ncbi:MAG: class I adenylate-forming enzyme family protein [bacterium]
MMGTPVKNVPDLIRERAREYGNKVFIAQAETEHDLSYSALAERCEKMGGLLAELGVAKGECVGVLLPNSPEFAVAVMGAQWIGAFAGPINTLLKENELEYILNHQESKVLVTDADFFPTLNSIINKLTHLEKIVELSTKYPHGIIVHPVKGVSELKAFYGTSLENSGEMPKEALRGIPKITTWDQLKVNTPKVSIGDKDPALILYTSGTTGVPKGALLSHEAILEVVEHLRKCAEAVPEDMILNILPLFHIFGLVFTLYGPLHAGSTTVTLKTFKPDLFVMSLLKYSITLTAIVPTIAFILLQVAEKLGQDSRFPAQGDLRQQAAVPVHQKFEQMFNLRIFEGYGLTEACMAGCLNTTEGSNRNLRIDGANEAGAQRVLGF